MNKPIRLFKMILPDFKEVEKLLQISCEVNQLANFGPLYYQLVEKLNDAFFLSSNKTTTIVSSGHTALMAAYHVLNSQRLYIPAYTFTSTIVAATLQGKTAILGDVNQITGAFDCYSVEEAIKYNCDTIVIVCPLSSIPFDIKDTVKFAKEKGLKVVIDGASTFGNDLSNIYMLGDAYCLSFHATKNLCLGEGGCVIHNKEYTDAYHQYINFGLNKNKTWTSQGLNAKVSELTCAVGIGLLNKKEKDFAIKKQVIKDLSKLFALSSNLFIPKTLSNIFSCYPVFAKTTEDAIKFRQLLSENNVETAQYYKLATLDKVQFPISWLLYNNNICLPTHNIKLIKRMERILNDF
jgi:dTDP-4-amino-4,6-dideoxygalactose transaminase